MPDTYASHISLNTQETLFLQSMIRGLATNPIVRATVSDIMDMDKKTFDGELSALEAKLKNDLFVPITNKIG